MLGMRVILKSLCVLCLLFTNCKTCDAFRVLIRCENTSYMTVLYVKLAGSKWYELCTFDTSLSRPFLPLNFHLFLLLKFTLYQYVYICNYTLSLFSYSSGISPGVL